MAYFLTSFLKSERKGARRPMAVAGALALLGLWLGWSEWLISNHILKPGQTALEKYVTCEPPLLVASLCVALALFAGLSSRVLKGSDREWLSRAPAGLLMFCIVWLGISFLVLMAPRWKPWQGSVLATAGAISGWITRRLRTDASGRKKSLALKAAPTVFIIALGIGLAIGTKNIIDSLSAHLAPFSGQTGPTSLAVIALTIVLALLSFSMAG